MASNICVNEGNDEELQRVLKQFTGIVETVVMTDDDEWGRNTSSSDCSEFLRAASLIGDEIGAKKRKRNRKGRRFKSRPSFEEATSDYNDKDFELAFRMSRINFEKLSDLLKEELKKNEDMALRSSAGALSVKARLAITLRMLAGGSVADLILIYKVARSTVYAIFREVVKSINGLLQFPSIPQNEQKLKKMATDFKFSRKIPDPFNGCIAVMDVIAVRIKKTRNEEDPRDYMCRKQFFSLPVQASVDANYKFLTFSSLTPGSSHDAFTFSVSNVASFLNNHKVPFEFYLAADEAYQPTVYILTPIPGTESSKDVYKDAYNFFLSFFRIHVEQAFGILTARWGMLKKGLMMSLSFAHKVIHCMLLLHNWLIDNTYCPEEKENYTSEEAEQAWAHWMEVIEEERNLHNFQDEIRIDEEVHD